MGLTFSKRSIFPIGALLTFAHLEIQKSLANVFKTFTFFLKYFFIQFLNFQIVSDVVQKSHLFAELIKHWNISVEGKTTNCCLRAWKDAGKHSITFSWMLEVCDIDNESFSNSTNLYDCWTTWHNAPRWSIRSPFCIDTNVFLSNQNLHLVKFVFGIDENNLIARWKLLVLICRKANWSILIDWNLVFLRWII